MSNISQVIEILRKEQFIREAETLEKLSVMLNSTNNDERKTASSEIQGLCQLRSYGELAIKSLNGWKWNTLLEKVAKYAQRKS